jgi:branched-chain amino acid transport system substrate-binding protein
MGMFYRMTISLCAGLLLALAGLVGARAAEPAIGEPLLIGVHYDAAKQASYYSLGQKSVFDVFVDQLNANGGIHGRPIKLLSEDDELNPVVATTKAEKLAAENVLMIISISGSATGLAVQKKGEELRIPIGSPGNFLEPLTTVPPKHYYFRFAMRDSVGGKALINYFRAHFKDPKIAVVRDATETGLLLSDSYISLLKNAGFTIVSTEQITPGSTDVTAQAMHVKESKADLVMLAGASVPDIAHYAKTHYLVGDKSPLFGNYLLSTPPFNKLAGDGANGLIYTDMLDPARPEVQQIEQTLVAKLGNKAKDAPFMIGAWEFIRWVADALNRAGPNPTRESLRDAMENTIDWPTAIGPVGSKVTFSPQRHDLFFSADEVVLRMIVNNQYGPAIKQ